MSLKNKIVHANPATWNIEGPKGNIFILGSIHFLPQNCFWLQPIIDKNLLDSVFFIGETPDYVELIDYFSKAAEPGGACNSKTPLKDLLCKEDFQALEKMMEDFGLPLEKWENYKPWFMANVLLANACAQGGFLGDYGIEAVLDPLVKNLEKPSFGLENPEIQFKIFDDLSLETQMGRLKTSIDNRENLLPSIEMLYESWRVGDLDSMYEKALKPLLDVPEFYSALIAERHPSWIRQIRRFLEIPGTHFLAAGVIHFIGPDSVLLMLERAGYTVTRIQ